MSILKELDLRNIEEAQRIVRSFDEGKIPKDPRRPYLIPNLIEFIRILLRIIATRGLN